MRADNSISSTVIKFFSCVELNDSTNVVSANPAISCNRYCRCCALTQAFSLLLLVDAVAARSAPHLTRFGVVRIVAAALLQRQQRSQFERFVCLCRSEEYANFRPLFVALLIVVVILGPCGVIASLVSAQVISEPLVLLSIVGCSAARLDLQISRCCA